MEEIAFLKNGRLIEFSILNLNYYKYLTLKSISMVIDLSVVFIAQAIAFMLLQVDLFMLGVIGVLYTLLYSMFMYLVFGRTIGNVVTRTDIVDKLGHEPNKKKYFIRSLFNTLYSVPIVGWALMITNVITTPFWKGITFNDYLSGTAIVTTKLNKELKNINSEILNEESNVLQEEERND